MSEDKPINLHDCLAEINNALNFWYPLRQYSDDAEHSARHVRLFNFRAKLEKQLRGDK